MEKIIVNTGKLTYTINDACEISMNPTDAGFIKRIFMAFSELDKRQEAAREEVEKADTLGIFEVYERLDKEMREYIDDLFGVAVCDAVFGKTNLYALADGLPLWCNFMFAIMDKVDAQLVCEEKKHSSAVNKYISKYNKSKSHK